MDQPAHAEKQQLKMAHGSFEVLKPSRAFLRPGTATGIDSLRRPVLSVSWAASTVFRYVTRTHARRWFDPQTPRAKTDSLSINAALPSLNSEPGCIKVVDTFRQTLPLNSIPVVTMAGWPLA